MKSPAQRLARLFCPRKLLSFAVALAGLVAATASASPATRWTLVPGVTSASIALSGQWDMKTSNALRWSDGRCALITYWATADKDARYRYLRCIDYMDANFQDTANSCYQPAVN